MKTDRTLPFLIAVCVAFAFLPSPARADLVKRPMYVNSKGKTVSQYVFQAGKSRYTKPSRGVTYGYGTRSGYFYGYRPIYRGYRPAYRHGHHHHHGGHVHGSFSGGKIHFRIGY